MISNRFLQLNDKKSVHEEYCIDHAHTAPPPDNWYLNDTLHKWDAIYRATGRN